MSAPLPMYEIYAIRYAERDGRRSEHFIGGDPHDAPMKMDYFVWVIRGENVTLLVDTGFDSAVAAKRNRRLLRSPRQAIAALGIDANAINTCVITHMHNDHAGTLSEFPRATFHIQDAEMAFATGRHMRHDRFRRSYERSHVLAMVALLFEDRVAFHDGDAEIAPAVSLHRIGGHTPGMQVVRVHTRRGWVVLASDASHYYEHFRDDRSFPAVYNVGDVLEGYARLRQLAESPEHVIPGHDPVLMRAYPRVSGPASEFAVRLDVAPTVTLAATAS